jgi:hypothetical protein
MLAAGKQMIGSQAKTRFDYAREALQKTADDERQAVNLLVRWYRQNSEVREAFIPATGVIEKWARQAVRKVRREQHQV